MTVVGRRIAVFLIDTYREHVSPLFGPTCRFRPTCSEYARTAVDRFGVFRGGYLAVRRVLRCHPFGGQGYDPVPGEDPITPPRDREMSGRSAACGSAPEGT
ncbi:MAG: membrane protein insertion efficiency factor YidD [Bacillota bacterium]